MKYGILYIRVCSRLTWAQWILRPSAKHSRSHFPNWLPWSRHGASSQPYFTYVANFIFHHSLPYIFIRKKNATNRRKISPFRYNIHIWGHYCIHRSDEPAAYLSLSRLKRKVIPNQGIWWVCARLLLALCYI